MRAFAHTPTSAHNERARCCANIRLRVHPSCDGAFPASRYNAAMTRPRRGCWWPPSLGLRRQLADVRHRRWKRGRPRWCDGGRRRRGDAVAQEARLEEVERRWRSREWRRHGGWRRWWRSRERRRHGGWRRRWRSRGWRRRGHGGGAGGASGNRADPRLARGGTGGALPTNIAFVTSTRVTADLGGVAGADTICQMHAQSAGLAGTYRAWLASSAGSAPSRLGAARGWRRADGLPIADTAASLLGDPRLFYLLTVNERGARTYATYVWTGTRADGSASAETCGDWTSPAEGQWGATGNGNLASIAWTAGGRNECATAQPLYCFGIDHANPVTAPPRPNPSRVVFTSRPFTLTSAGIAAADAFCAAEAAAANLPGTYARAALADSATQRTTASNRPPAARGRGVDGVVPSATPLASTTQSLRAALNVTSDGTYLTGGSVWTGALTPVDTGSASLNCNAFTSTSSTASSVYGTVHDSSEWWSPSPADSVPCNATTLRLYCLQR